MTKTLTIPSKLENAIKNNSLVIFVGAGCSMPLGLPSWKTLIEDILQDLHNKYGEKSDTHFQNILNGVKANTKTLFDALNKVENDPDNGAVFKIKTQEFINFQIEEISKKFPKESKVHDLLWKISSKIITTNYDKILEKYIPKSISPKIFDNSNAFQSLKSQSSNAEFLYKIHGDYEDPNSIILFESDYRDIYKNENYNTDTLATHFKEKTLLFIGFSLTDPFVNDLFLKIKGLYNGYSIKEHFIFTTKNEDFIKYGVTPIKIDDWDESLLNYLLKLEQIKLSIEEKIEDLTIREIEKEKGKDEEDLTVTDLTNIADLIEKKIKEVEENPSDKELNKEINDLKNKFNHLFFAKIDYLQEVNKPSRDADLQNLFELIYSSKKLDYYSLEKINKVRRENSIYKWYDRSVIVSAITCSLIHNNVADENKISLLIDFINDNEEKVWQKALTSLFIVLNHLGNKWLKYPSIITKIKSLNQNLRIQDGCETIIMLYNIGLNNVSINEELFSNSYFSESPYNYFLPYHQEENPAFDLVYETYKENDIEEFIDFLSNAPIPDQLKYILCSNNESKNDNNSITEEDTKMLKKVLHFNFLFYPFSIYVQEIISFYRYFPVFNHKEILNSQFKLTETKLKDYLLNAEKKHTSLGLHFVGQKNWSQAIFNLKEAIKLDESKITNLIHLAHCYSKNNDIRNEIIIRNTLIIKDPNNETNLCRLYHIYQKIEKNFTNSLNIANRLITIDNNNPDYLNYRGVAYKELGEYEDALEDYNKAINIDSENAMFYNNRANSFYILEENELALLDWTKAISLNPENEDYYCNRAGFLSNMDQYKKAVEDYDKLISINNKKGDYFLDRATCNLSISRYSEALFDIRQAEKLGVKKSHIYHKYSNYYRLTNNFDKAFEYIEKAEKLERDNRITGTKATIYASMGDDDHFYEYLEEAFIDGADANLLFPDIKEKYLNKERFTSLLKKYNQEIKQVNF